MLWFVAYSLRSAANQALVSRALALAPQAYNSWSEMPWRLSARSLCLWVCEDGRAILFRGMGGGYGPSLESSLSKQCYSIDEHCSRQLMDERADWFCWLWLLLC